MPDFKTIAVVPDLPGHLPAPQQHKNLTITRQPIDLTNMSSWAELIVCHAGHGTLALASCQRVPSANSPITLKQTMLAKRVEAANAGITLPRGATPNDAARQIAGAVSQLTGKAGARRIQTLRVV